MQDTLKIALEGYVSPERTEVLMDAVQLIADSGQDTPLDELSEVIEMQNGMADSATFIGRIDDTIHVALNDTLAQLGVTCLNEAGIDIKTDILRTVASLESYIIPEHVIGLIDGNFTNEEIIATMVPIFSTRSIEEVMDVLVVVTDESIGRLAEVVKNNLLLRGPSEDDLPRDNTARLARLNRLIRHLGAERISIVYELTQSGVRAGRPLTALLGQFIEAFLPMSPERVATEMLALVLFSDTPLAEVRKVTTEQCHDYTDSVGEQRLMEMTLTPLFPIIE